MQPQKDADLESSKPKSLPFCATDAGLAGHFLKPPYLHMQAEFVQKVAFIFCLSYAI